MSEETDPLDEACRFLKQKRDELKLHMHLAGKDAQDEFAQLEQKWKELEKQSEPLSGAIRDAAASAESEARNLASAALETLARDLQTGYDKLQEVLKKE